MVIGPMRAMRAARRAPSGVVPPSSALGASGPDNEANSRQQHGQGQNLTHGDAAGQETDMQVRLAEHFGDKTRQGVPNQERAGQKSAGAQGPETHKDEQHDEKSDTLEAGYTM